MSKILVLKNDRVGDLANSLRGINSLLNENSDKQIEIILSDISKDLSFLFKIKNVKITYLNYTLNIFDKIKLFFKVLTSNYKKIYILTPKNIYFYLPLISRAKIFAITITNKNKSRPFKYLRSKFDNASLGGFKQTMTMVKDLAVDFLLDPINLVAMAASPLYMGASVATKQGIKIATKNIKYNS